MNRINFIKNSLLGVGAIAAAPSALMASKKNEESTSTAHASNKAKTLSQLIQENIVGDREGVALQIKLTILDKQKKSVPLANATVDVWHCDANGDYSKFDGNIMYETAYTKENYLRGRQTSDENGEISFISIFPGWYTSRAPHIHVRVEDSSRGILQEIQMALPKDVCDIVYSTEHYPGLADTVNEEDVLFSKIGKESIADTVIGNPIDGYVLEKTITV